MLRISKKILQKYFLKLLLVFLILLIFNYDTTLFMESEKEILQNQEPKETWFEWLSKYEKILLIVTGFSLALLIGFFISTDLDFLLWDLKSVACPEICDQIKNLITHIKEQPQFASTRIKMLENLIKDYKFDKIRVEEPEKFEEIIKKIIEILKQSK